MENPLTLLCMVTGRDDYKVQLVSCAIFLRYEYVEEMRDTKQLLIDLLSGVEEGHKGEFFPAGSIDIRF